MHGAKAFKDFIDKKSTRVPEFLEVVSEQQEQAHKTDIEETSQEKKNHAPLVQQHNLTQLIMYSETI